MLELDSSVGTKTLWRNSLKYELTNSTICLQWMESCERWSRDSFSEYFLWPPASHYRSSGVHFFHTQPFFTIFRVWWECLTCFCDWESVEFSWLYHSNCWNITGARLQRYFYQSITSLVWINGAEGRWLFTRIFGILFYVRCVNLNILQCQYIDQCSDD